MWVKGTNKDQVKFSVVYRTMIKLKVKRNYRYMRAFFNHPISYEDIETEIHGLIQAYPSKPYTPTIDIIVKEKVLVDVSIVTRLNAIHYALSTLTDETDAHFVLEPCPDTSIEFVEQPLVIHRVRWIDMLLLFIVCVLLYLFGYVSLRTSGMLWATLSIIMYIMIWKL